MTFEEWFIKEYHVDVNKDTEYKNTDTYDISEYAWNAAIDAAATKLARGTNLYNICGDHISGQVIESDEQLKSS